MPQRLTYNSYQLLAKRMSASQKNVCESKECLRVKRMSASQKNVCESNECLRAKWMSASHKNVCESKECLRAKRMSASQKNVCELKECLCGRLTRQARQAHHLWVESLMGYLYTPGIKCFKLTVAGEATSKSMGSNIKLVVGAS